MFWGRNDKQNDQEPDKDKEKSKGKSRDKSKDNSKGNSTSENSGLVAGTAKADRVARTGNFFRTRVYSISTANSGTAASNDTHDSAEIPYSDNGILKWREAYEDKLANTWTVYEVSRSPNLETVGEDTDDFIVQRQPLKGLTNIPMVAAIENLLQYEKSSKKLGYGNTGDSIETYGAEHVMQFALNEGLAPDIHGHAHEAVKGKVIAPGAFSERTLERVQQTHDQKTDTPEPSDIATLSIPEVRLGNLFSRTAETRDINRFIESINTHKAWVQVTGLLAGIVNEFANMQTVGELTAWNDIQGRIPKGSLWDDPKNRELKKMFEAAIEPRYDDYKNSYRSSRYSDDNGYSREDRQRTQFESLLNHFANLNATKNPKTGLKRYSQGEKEEIGKIGKNLIGRAPLWGELEFNKAKGKVHKALEDSGLQQNEDLSEYVQRFIEIVSLSLEIAYAKEEFKRFKSGKYAELKKSRLLEQIKKIEGRIKKLGGTEDDIKAAHAEILDMVPPQAQTAHPDLLKSEEAADQETVCDDQSAEKTQDAATLDDERFNHLKSTYGLDITNPQSANSPYTFFPDIIMDYLISFDEIASQLEDGSDFEANRITHQKTVQLKGLSDLSVHDETSETEIPNPVNVLAAMTPPKRPEGAPRP